MSVEKRFEFLGELPHADPRPSVRVGLDLLKEAGVPYALIGRVAVWMHTTPEFWRQTLDADFAVSAEDMGGLRTLAEREGHRVEELSIGGIRVWGRDPGVVVEFVMGSPDYETLLREIVLHAEKDEVAGIRVAPRDLLIVMKLIPHEEKDESDVESLLMKVLKNPASNGPGSISAAAVGDAACNSLDRIARKIGHPGAGMVQKN